MTANYLVEAYCNDCLYYHDNQCTCEIRILLDEACLDSIPTTPNCIRIPLPEFLIWLSELWEKTDMEENE